MSDSSGTPDGFAPTNLHVVLVPTWAREATLLVGVLAVLATLALAPFMMVPVASSLVWRLAFFARTLVSRGWGGNPWARDVTGTLRVDARGVWLEGRLLVERALVAKGFAVPVPDGTDVDVRLHDRAGQCLADVRVASLADAEAVLRALGIAPEQQACSFAAVSPLIATRKAAFVTMCASVVLPILALVGGLRVVPLLILYALQVLALLPAFVDVGTDGIARRWLFRKSFVRNADVTAVEATSNGVRVSVKDRDAVELALVPPTWAPPREARALKLRIEEALRAGEAGTPLAARIVGRDDRSAADWLASLRAVAAGGYREGVGPEELLAIVENPKATASARVGAAVALRVASADEPAQERIRVAAQGVAEPEVREALLGSLDGTDGELESVLEKVGR